MQLEIRETSTNVSQRKAASSEGKKKKRFNAYIFEILSPQVTLRTGSLDTELLTAFWRVMSDQSHLGETGGADLLGLPLVCME